MSYGRQKRMLQSVDGVSLLIEVENICKAIGLRTKSSISASALYLDTV